MPDTIKIMRIYQQKKKIGIVTRIPHLKIGKELIKCRWWAN